MEAQHTPSLKQQQEQTTVIRMSCETAAAQGVLQVCCSAAAINGPSPNTSST
jgi:hypothetical protein